MACAPCTAIDPTLVGRQAFCPDPEHPATAVYGDAPATGPGSRISPTFGRARLAVSGGRHGPVLTQDRRLVGTLDDPSRAGAKCHPDGRPLRRSRGTLIHSDQGTQYRSDAWRRFCRTNHLEPSMSRKGNCWTNAVAEMFFSSLKERAHQKHIYKTASSRSGTYPITSSPSTIDTSSQATLAE